MIDIDLNSASIPLSWHELFGRRAPTTVEIGTGKGKFLNELALARPDENILGVERSAKYHRLCCHRAERRGLCNVRLLRTTGEDLLARLLPRQSVTTLFVLFPDPWPKKRHHKRRFVRSETMPLLHRALVPGGRLMVKSDHDGYAEVIDEVLRGADGFQLLDAEKLFAELPVTGFEQKYQVEGRSIHSWALESTG
jgi:tRNA (guanine-N7-)-methyltransferase